MTLTLVFPRGEHPQVRLDPGVACIGSDPAAQIVLKHPGVRPQHGQLRVSDIGVMLDVPHGTPVEVNGRRVDGLIALRPGDSVAFDQVRARVAAADGTDCARACGGAAAPVVRAAPGATCVHATLPAFVLRGVTGGAFGRSYALARALTVGRSPECDIHVDAPGLSRLHARLIPAGDGVLVEDLASTNGTFVNDHRVRHYTLHIGDEIRFDQVRFRLAGSGTNNGANRGEDIRAVRTAEAVPELRRPWAATVAIGGMVLALAALGAGYLL
ncbi:FHA domain-containing protein [Lysobacter terrae]